MGSRDPVFRHLRVGAGLVAWVGLALLVWSVQGTIGNVGGKIFQIFHVLWACVLLLLSIGLTAPVLVSERIGGTLGLLFLTCLRPFEVVGGKGLAALLRMTTLWLSGLPIGMVPFVMGSVTLFDAMFYATFQFAMVSCGLSAGLLFSAATKDRRSALRGAMGVGLGIATIVLGIWGVFSLPLSFTPVWVRHLVGTVYALGAGGGVLLFTLFTSAAILGQRWREGSDTAPNAPTPDPVEAAEEAHWRHAWREGHGRVMREPVRTSHASGGLVLAGSRFVDRPDGGAVCIRHLPFGSSWPVRFSRGSRPVADPGIDRASHRGRPRLGWRGGLGCAGDRGQPVHPQGPRNGCHPSTRAHASEEVLTSE
jgi:hypothetical protein